MNRRSLGSGVEKIGQFLMLAGGASIALIFLVVILNGGWPDFLSPVQHSARTISDAIGNLVWLVWVAVFVGPGFLVSSLGDWIKSKA